MSTALVTGASAGIGRELARDFAEHGYDLVLVARRLEALESLAADLTSAHGVRATALAADLSAPGAPRQLFDRLEGDHVAIDVLVNNAGFGAQGAIAELPLARQLEMLQVNVTALTELTRLFLPGMVARNRGGVLNVASTAAFQPGPYMAVYYATKAYVLSFTEALAEEVAGTALRISCLSPGRTATEFADVAQTNKTRLARFGSMPAADVARAGYDGWARGRVVVVPGATNFVGTLLPRLVPRGIVRKIAKRLNTSDQ